MSFDRPTVIRVGGPADHHNRPPALDAPKGRPRHLKVAGDERREHLDALREAINSGTSFTTRLVAPVGADWFLRVVNTDAAKLAEDIGCRIEEDGDYWFTWSWGDTISPADDLNGTVEAIRRVLTSGG